MRVTGQYFVQFAIASIALFPSLILTETTPEQVKTIFSREYFSTVLKQDIVFILGGSSQTLDVPFLNITTGLDAQNPEWSWWSAPKDATLRPYDRGVAFKGVDNDIYIQGGGQSTSTLENLVIFKDSSSLTSQWAKATVTGNIRPATSLMTATVDPLTGIAYYYGGQPLTNHLPDYSKHPLSTFYSFDPSSSIWKTLIQSSPPTTIRPGRTAHTSNIINQQIFIMGGLTYGANATTQSKQAGFESVLVYDIVTNNVISVTTLGDVPEARQSYSTALGLDGHSIVVYGGHINDGTTNFNPASSDVYTLDTCTLTWTKQTVSGTPPGTLFAHGAVNINDYMTLFMGKKSNTEYNDKIYILDLKQWKWVTNIKTTTDSIPSSSCRFQLPSVNATNFVPYDYDFGIIANPYTPTEKKSKGKSFGIGFGVFAVVLIAAGVFYYMKRVRNKKSRTLNPRWMRNTPTQQDNSHSNDRDYPLFVYNKELDKDNTNNPNMPRHHPAPFAPNGVRTYTASDHEQWEQQLNQASENPDHTESRQSDIWKRMRGLNDASVISDEEVQKPHNTNNTSGRLVDL